MALSFSELYDTQPESLEQDYSIVFLAPELNELTINGFRIEKFEQHGFMNCYIFMRYYTSRLKLMSTKTSRKIGVERDNLDWVLGAATRKGDISEEDKNNIMNIAFRESLMTYVNIIRTPETPDNLDYLLKGGRRRRRRTRRGRRRRTRRSSRRLH